jgi:iron complex transport system substrate-binding protein
MVLVCGCFLLLPAGAEGREQGVTVLDSMNRRVVLPKPARRIVALAPHIVENLFAAGAGHLIVGTVDYANYPEEAKKIPSLGPIGAFSLEKLVTLKPDLVILWYSAKGQVYLDQITALNIPVYVDEPQKLHDIPRAIRQFGILTQQLPASQKTAQQFELTLQHLKKKYHRTDRKTVFYQVWNQPLQTINDQHAISAVIQLCGGRNIFGPLKPLAPVVSLESLLSANPDVILASGMDEQRPEWLDAWKQYPQLKAVKNNRLFFIPPDLLQRQTPRILQGAQQLCSLL